MKKVLLVLVSVLILVGCGKTNALVGKWNGDTEDGMNTTFVFEKNGDVKYDNEYGFDSKGTYKVKGDEVTITLESWSDSKVYKYEVKGKKLTLTATDKLSPSYKSMTKKD